jgi:hypothetical protein
MGAELFHADRRTDMKKLIVICRDFAKALKKMRVIDYLADYLHQSQRRNTTFSRVAVLNNSTTNVIKLLCTKDLNRHYKFPISTAFLTFKSGVHKFQATKSFTVAPNICGSSEWNLLQIALLMP